MLVVVFVIVVFPVVNTVVLVAMLVVVPVVPAVVLLVVNDVLFVCKFQVTDKLLLEVELLTAYLMEILRCIVIGRMLSVLLK